MFRAPLSQPSNTTPGIGSTAALNVKLKKTIPTTQQGIEVGPSGTTDYATAAVYMKNINSRLTL
jgi:hypothetical protein